MGTRQAEADSLLEALEDEESVDALLAAVARIEPRALSAATAEEGLPESRPVSRQRGRSSLPAVNDVVDGRYRVEEVLGAGGMGVVYAARNLRTNKQVALKYLASAPGGPDRERVRRFMREALAAGRIRHPNVVDVYDVGGEASVPYLVMERLHGETLRDRLKRGPIAQQEALATILAAMEGVAEAHRQGVIHRDLKPDNIFLARDLTGTALTPKVLDFGVSRISSPERELSSMTTLTRAGVVLGTPAYMPLEQLRGRAVDVRADIYALAVVLYEMLSGRRPYEASREPELIVMLATLPPTPLRTHLPALDDRLEQVIQRALARNPADRYQTVDAFAEALRSWCSQRRTFFSRRHLRSLALGSAAVCVVSGMLVQSSTNTQTRRAAIQAADSAPARAASRADSAPQMQKPRGLTEKPAPKDATAPPIAQTLVEQSGEFARPKPPARRPGAASRLKGPERRLEQDTRLDASEF
jgi:serine/threonine protein kinase